MRSTVNDTGVKTFVACTTAANFHCRGARRPKPSEHTQCTKHYALKLVFLRESMGKRNIDFKYLPMEVMPTDIFMKALGCACVVELHSLINLIKPKIKSKGRVV